MEYNRLQFSHIVFCVVESLQVKLSIATLLEFRTICSRSKVGEGDFFACFVTYDYY